MTRITRVRLGLGTFLAASILGVVLLPADAEAGRRYVTPQAPCETVGATGIARNGETYECRLKPGADCPRWSWIWHSGPVGPWSPRPGGPCTKCSASPGQSSAAPSSAAPRVKPSTSTAAAQASPAAGGEDYNNHPGTLPVTANASDRIAALAAIAGTALVFFGAVLLSIAKPWRRHN